MKKHLRIFLASVFLASLAGTGIAWSAGFTLEAIPDESVPIGPSPDELAPSGPINYGAGNGVEPSTQDKSALTKIFNHLAAPTATPAAATGGFFAAPAPWPIIPIHMALLPDGRVMSFGTNEKGQQGAAMFYDVWSPLLGTGSDAHTVLPNKTGTDIFCGSQSLSPITGQLIINGGDLTLNRRNYSNNLTTIFNPQQNTIANGTPMAYPRWYSTLLALPNGDVAAFGGRSNNSTLEGLPPSIPVITPEEYNVTKGWQTLTGLSSAAAFNQWFYPRVAVAPGGSVFLVNVVGTLFSLDLSHNGSVTKLKQTIAPANPDLPAVSYAPGKMLSIRAGMVTALIDYTQPVPVVSTTDKIDAVRHWSSTTVMADGKVLLTGGSAVENQNQGVDYQAEIWDPATGHWTAGASAAIPRLYHSNSLLLTNGAVLTGGGGAPGP